MQTTDRESTGAFRNLIGRVQDEMKVCIDNCLTCSQVCEQAIQHCLSKGGKHAEPKHIRLLQDCADICATSARFMLRDSAFHASTCEACADLCEACAKECEGMADDPAMKTCAEVCVRCAESCRRMASGH